MANREGLVSMRGKSRHELWMELCESVRWLRERAAELWRGQDGGVKGRGASWAGALAWRGQAPALDGAVRTGVYRVVGRRAERGRGKDGNGHGEGGWRAGAVACLAGGHGERSLGGGRQCLYVLKLDIG
jgi:hypothetical protein